MDYFPNGDFTKNYPLPGIGYYMSNIPTSVPNGQPPQGILTLTPPTFEQGQHFVDNTDFSNFQHHQQQQQQYQQQLEQQIVAVPRGQQQQYGMGGGGGQKRKAAAYAMQQQQLHMQPHHRNELGEPMTKDGRKLDPFAPECSIPLPYQLGDEYSYYGPTAVWKRNERERHRVRCVNDGYEKLRNHLPVPDKDKRLSKVETLRFAIRYIQHLEKMLADERHDEQCDCDFTVRSSSVSDSCQSPAVTTTEQRQQQRNSSGRGGKNRRYVRRASSDETSDDNEDGDHN